MSIDIAWAVTPTAVRDTVLEEGLLPRLDHGEDELYLFHTRERAQRYAESVVDLYVDTPEGRADVWEAQVSGLPASVIDDEDAHTAFVKGTVPPAGMRLVHTVP